MTIAVNLSFDGHCEEAFALYARLLGGTVTFALRYEDSPMAGDVPETWRGKIVHSTLTMPDGSRLHGCDAAPGTYDAPCGVSLTVGAPDAGTAQALFTALAAGGSVTLPLAPTFWAAAFGTVVDRYGVPWAINCEGPGEGALPG